MVYVCLVFDWRIVVLKRNIPLEAPVISVYLDYPLRREMKIHTYSLNK